jgi:two-component system, OmpR family, response regulator
MNQPKKASILLVEDDKNLGFILKDYLELLGYSVVLKENGVTGIEAFIDMQFDLCILDIMMPLKDGFTLAEEIRAKNNLIPIIFLSAKSMKEDRIKGFKIGADDYITKPFSTEELSLRIQAIMKRVQQSKLETLNEGVFNIGNYLFDYDNHTLSYNNNVRKLTRREADMLNLLYRNKNQVVRREVALEEIWGENDYFKGRSMDVYITKLRSYLRNDISINIINVHGTGFKLEISDF